MSMSKYYAEEVNGKGYIYNKDFSEKVPAFVESTYEFALEQVDKLNLRDLQEKNEEWFWNGGCVGMDKMQKVWFLVKECGWRESSALDMIYNERL